MSRESLEATDATYLKTFTPPQDQVAQRNANILVENLTMSLRSVIVPKNPHRSDDSHTWGVSRDKDHTLLLVDIGVVRITLAHNDVDFRPWVSGSANPPANR